MNNDILIIIHRDKCKDVLEAMYDLINYPRYSKKYVC